MVQKMPKLAFKKEKQKIKAKPKNGLQANCIWWVEVTVYWDIVS